MYQRAPTRKTHVKIPITMIAPRSSATIPRAGRSGLVVVVASIGVMGTFASPVLGWSVRLFVVVRVVRVRGPLVREDGLGHDRDLGLKGLAEPEDLPEP